MGEFPPADGPLPVHGVPACCSPTHPHAHRRHTHVQHRLENDHLVATKIKLMRLGKMRAPYYRIVVADARTKRDGRSIETIGKYHPKEDPSFIQVDGDRAAYWLSVGAQPTEAVTAILKVTGDWQKFKGLPAPPPMLVAPPRADKKAVFEAAAREGIDGASGAATTPKKKAAPKKATEAAAAEAPAAEEVPVGDAAAQEAPVAEAAVEEAPVAEAAVETPAAAEEAPAPDAAAADDATSTEE
jgi:small subunit ribosomal protein S16